MTATRPLLVLATGSDDAGLRALLGSFPGEHGQSQTDALPWRHFETPRRRLSIAVAPGSQLFTRYLAAGSPRCDLALLLADADGGAPAEALRRDRAIFHLLGIDHVVVAANSAHLDGWREPDFAALRGDLLDHFSRLGLPLPQVIPVSTRQGDNVAIRSAGMPWYRGPALLECLESAVVAHGTEPRPLRFLVREAAGAHEHRVCKATLASGEARGSKLPLFTGISSPYEPPEAPELVIDTSAETLQASVRRVLDLFAQDPAG